MPQLGDFGRVSRSLDVCLEVGGLLCSLHYPHSNWQPCNNIHGRSAHTSKNLWEGYAGHNDRKRMPALLKDTMTLRGGPLTLIKKCRVAPCSTGLILSFFLQLPFPSRPQGEEAVKREEKMSPIRVQTSSGSFIQDTPIKDYKNQAVRPCMVIVWKKE